MKRTLFATPQDAETAFYEAFAKADLEAMMEVWADDDDIYCVHPGGSRISGVEPVRDSWRQIFGSGQSLRFNVSDPHVIHTMTLAVHSVYEHIAATGPSPARQTMIAANVYQRGEHGWRMVAHQAAPVPSSAVPAAATERDVKTLH